MKKLLACVAFTTVALLGSCAQQQDAAPAAPVNTVCMVSGEPVDAKVTADYMGGKVGFCCEKCLAKWNGMDDAAKKAAFDAKVKKG